MTMMAKQLSTFGMLEASSCSRNAFLHILEFFEIQINIWQAKRKGFLPVGIWLDPDISDFSQEFFHTRASKLSWIGPCMLQYVDVEFFLSTFAHRPSWSELAGAALDEARVAFGLLGNRILLWDKLTQFMFSIILSTYLHEVPTNLLWGTSSYFQLVRGTFRYFKVLLNTSMYLEVLLGTLRYF